MQNPKRNRRLTIFGLIITIIILIIYFSAETVIENLLRNEIKKQLNTNPSRHYNISTGNIKIEFISGRITIDNIRISPTDSARQILNDGQLKNLMDLQLNDFELKGLRVFHFLRTQNMHISTLKASDIRLDAMYNPEIQQKSNPNKLRLKDIFSDQFTGAQINKIEIDNFAFNRFHYQDTSNATMRLDSLFLSFSNVNLDSLTVKNTIPANFDNLKIRSGDILLNASRFYKIATRDIAFSLLDSTLTIDGFQLIPKYAKFDFSKQIKYNTDWFNITIPQLHIRNIHLTDVFKSEFLHIDQIAIEKPAIEIFRDKTVPDPPFKFKPLLASMIHNIPIPVQVDSLLISNGKLVYEETSKDHQKVGQVFFEPFTISVHNFTNIDTVIANNNMAIIDFQGTLMGKTSVTTTIKADLAGSLDYFEVEGKMGTMAATAINPLVENLLFVSIKSGNINKTYFYFYANDDHSTGEVFLEYSDLKVEILNAEDPNKQRIAQSFVANNLIRNNNLKTDHKYLIGQINFERDKNKGLPNYLWKSLQSGIISIVAPVASKETKAEKRKKSTPKKKKEKRD